MKPCILEDLQALLPSVKMGDASKTVLVAERASILSAISIVEQKAILERQEAILERQEKVLNRMDGETTRLKVATYMLLIATALLVILAIIPLLPCMRHP